MHVPSRSSVHRQSDQPAGPCHHVVAGSIPHPALTTRDEAGSDRRRPPPTGPGRLGGNREPGRPTIRGRLGGCSDHGGAPSSPWCDRVRRSLVRRRVVVGTSPSQSWPTSFRCRRSRGRRRSLHRDGRRTCGRICRLRRHRSPSGCRGEHARVRVRGPVRSGAVRADLRRTRCARCRRRR